MANRTIESATSSSSTALARHLLRTRLSRRNIRHGSDVGKSTTKLYWKNEQTKKFKVKSTGARLAKRKKVKDKTTLLRLCDHSGFVTTGELLQLGDFQGQRNQGFQHFLETERQSISSCSSLQKIYLGIFRVGRRIVLIGIDVESNRCSA